MKGWILLGGLLLFVQSLFSQSLECYLTDSIYKHELKIRHSAKTEEFAVPMGYASAKFPELAGVHIEVRRKNIFTMMAARPKMDFLFRKRSNRRYVIYITDHPDMNAGPIFAQMSECAQAGVLGHELSHILAYNKKNNLQMLWFGIKYLFSKRKIEEETDLVAMERGFGDHLLEYTRYIHASPHTNRNYLRMKKKHYLSVNEMKAKYLELF